MALGGEGGKDGWRMMTRGKQMSNMGKEIEGKFWVPAVLCIRGLGYSAGVLFFFFLIYLIFILLIFSFSFCLHLG